MLTAGSRDNAAGRGGRLQSLDDERRLPCQSPVRFQQQPASADSAANPKRRSRRNPTKHCPSFNTTTEPQAGLALSSANQAAVY